MTEIAAITHNDTLADQNAIGVEADKKNHLSEDNIKCLPKIERLIDIGDKENEIIEWCDNNPLEDYIYTFKRESIYGENFNVNYLPFFQVPNIYVAGSYVLRQLLDHLFKYTETTEHVNPFDFRWKSNDIDLFLVDCKTEGSGRNKMGKGLDIVITPDKTIEDLLLGFDLPVCRVGFGMDGTYYVSIQAMYSILQRKMNIPIYFKNKESAYLVLKNQCSPHYYGNNNNNNKDLPLFLVDRFYERLKKYSGRGFGVKWINTTTVVDWIKRRSAYAMSRKY